MEKQSANGEKKKIDIRKEVISWVQSIVISVVVAVLIVTFVGRPMRVDGSSMEPNFSGNDRIIATNLHGDLKYGDVVVIKRNDKEPLIKRIIATEGQKIYIDYDKKEVFVDDKILNEPYINQPTEENLGLTLPAVVPDGCVFVMGDNRNHSDDSRNPDIGMIDERRVFGKVVFRYYPFGSAGTISFDKINDSKA